LRRLLGAGAFLLAMASCAASFQGLVSPELLDRARGQGSILVIVTLRAPGGAPPTVVEAIKQSVLTEIASTRHRVVRSLAGLPQIVLEASEDTLHILGVSTNVLRIDASIPESPTR
jgi:hypothetical protein